MALSLQVGFVTTFLLMIVVLPIAAVVWKSTGNGWSGFWSVVSSPQAVAALKLTLIMGYDTLKGGSGEKPFTNTSINKTFILGGGGSDVVSFVVPSEPGFKVVGNMGADKLRMLPYPNPALQPRSASTSARAAPPCPGSCRSRWRARCRASSR